MWARGKDKEKNDGEEREDDAGHVSAARGLGTSRKDLQMERHEPRHADGLAPLELVLLHSHFAALDELLRCVLVGTVRAVSLVLGRRQHVRYTREVDQVEDEAVRVR